MRDELDIAFDRPSRVSRVVVLLSTLAVAGIAIWVFSPILLANYTAFTMARTTGGPPPAAPVAATRAIAAVAPVAPAAAATPTTSSSDTTAAAAADEPAAPSAVPPALRNFNARAGSGWPNDPPAASLPPAFAATNDPPVTSAIAPPNDPPAARADANTMRLAAVSPATASTDAANTVPLPRARPSRLIAARLAIPLPRPRPDIPDEAPARPSSFDLQVERMR